MEKYRNLKFIELEHGTPEWLKYRVNGIGGSEIASILNRHPYKSAMRVYAEKIGYAEEFLEDNEAMYHGRNLEQYVVDNIWRFHDGTKSGYIKHGNDGNIIRGCREIKAYAINPKYPYLFASVDRLINSGQPTYYSLCKDAGIGSEEDYTGKPMVIKKDGVLEVKSIAGQYAKIWENEIPIYYGIQCMDYMIVYELDYCELISFIDGRRANLYVIELTDSARERIIEEASDFWNNRVVPGKKACASYWAHQGTEAADKFLGEIDRLMPPPDTTDDCKEFMKEKYRNELSKVRGSEGTYNVAMKIHYINAVIKVLGKKKDYLLNYLYNQVYRNHCDMIDYGAKGYIKRLQKEGSETWEIYNGVKKPKDLNDIARELASCIKTFNDIKV